MNVNPIIEKIFENFSVDSENIPIAFLYYIGKSDSYLVYSTIQEQGKDFCDNKHREEVSYVTIDVFSRKNFKKTVQKVKDKMIDGGFTWTDNSYEEFDSETGYYHVPMNFYINSPVEVPP
jgi:hypothetical protein